MGIWHWALAFCIRGYRDATRKCHGPNGPPMERADAPSLPCGQAWGKAGDNGVDGLRGPAGGTPVELPTAFHRPYTGLMPRFWHRRKHFGNRTRALSTPGGRNRGDGARRHGGQRERRRVRPVDSGGQKTGLDVDNGMAKETTGFLSTLSTGYHIQHGYLWLLKRKRTALYI